MDEQRDLTYEMRSILVDWLVDVAKEYTLHSETIFIAVNLIDRFLSFKSVLREKFQLVGTTCMWIAA
jgi:cyclin A